MQAKLLRIIQEKEFERLGNAKVINIDVRFIAASNKDIKDLISRGEFREDLFYRLNVFPITLPPLRKRKNDIPLLLGHFFELNAKNAGKLPKKISKKALQTLIEYDWPGNIRELQNLAERLFTISKNAVIDIEDISTLNIHKRKNNEMTLKEAVDAFEKQCIDEVLELVNGNKTMAAKKLGVHRNTLLAKTNKWAN